jgi:hypothetical protein
MEKLLSSWIKEAVSFPARNFERIFDFGTSVEINKVPSVGLDSGHVSFDAVSVD